MLGRIRADGACRDGIFLLSVPVAYFAPDAAPYLWLVLFVDPSSRLAARSSAPDDEGDRPPRL
jgi:hypothetical protein